MMPFVSFGMACLLFVGLAAGLTLLTSTPSGKRPVSVAAMRAGPSETGGTTSPKSFSSTAPTLRGTSRSNLPTSDDEVKTQPVIPTTLPAPNPETAPPKPTEKPSQPTSPTPKTTPSTPPEPETPPLPPDKLNLINPPATEVKAAFPTGDGLVVQVGATEASFLTALTNGGKRLAHGLTLDSATRDKVRSGLITSKVHPQASVSVWYGKPGLPYADRLVNLLILDRDGLDTLAPSAEECKRVVAPGGTILARVGGAWKQTVVARPDGFANWTHFDGGPDGNAVSEDAEATGIHGLQWIDNVRAPRWEKTGPHGGDQGNIRVWGRYMVTDLHIRPMDKDPKFEPRVFLECRDVNNGLLIWQKPRRPDLSPKRWALAVADGLCFTWLTSEGPLTAIDLATGKELRTYPGSEPKPYLQVSRKDKKIYPEKGFQGDNHWVRVAGKTILANGNGPLQAWSLEGKPLWTFSKQGQRLELPAVDEQRNVVYGLMIEEKPVSEWGLGSMYWGRWPTSNSVQSIVALDLTTGAVKWENTDVASKASGFEDSNTKTPLLTEFGQLIAAGDYVVATNSDAIGGGHLTAAASLDAATGKLLHFDPKRFERGKERSIGSYDAVYRDGLVYLMSPSLIWSFDPKSGEAKQVFSLAWNGRCYKPIATKEMFLVGQTAFLKKNFGGEMFAMARSGCANSVVPGAGLMLFAPHLCSCVTHLDGYFATTSRPAPPLIPENARLVKGPEKTANLPALNEKSLPTNLISQAWSWFTISVPVKPVTIEKAGWTFDLNPQAHCLRAHNGKNQWNYFADARIGADLAVVDERVILGSHDGWVHCLDLKSGALQWRYLAAPAQRLIIANGMLTSSWPVFGVADLGEGMIVASAGTHAELDGGIRVVALKLEDGSLAWARNLHKKPTEILPRGEGMGGRRGKPIAEFSLINAAPTVEGGRIVIDGGAHLNRFEFSPAETEEQLNTRLLEQKRR
jgi:outer membrane protein assembly factor BamB